ncbi:cytosolic regulator of adenylyl cyclase [Pelomyxa schiedti]|nr:cytosolic regulator of adenylyl cyclase [Pelomyxa schiedti]
MTPPPTSPPLQSITPTVNIPPVQAPPRITSPPVLPPLAIPVAAPAQNSTAATSHSSVLSVLQTSPSHFNAAIPPPLSLGPTFGMPPPPPLPPLPPLPAPTSPLLRKWLEYGLSLGPTHLGSPLPQSSTQSPQENPGSSASGPVVPLPEPLKMVPIPPPIVDLYESESPASSFKAKRPPFNQFSPAQMCFLWDKKGYLAQVVSTLSKPSQNDRLCALNNLIEISQIVQDIALYHEPKALIDAVREFLISRIRPLRIAGMRALHGFCKTSHFIAALNNSHIPFFIARSLERPLSARDKQGEERNEAFKFCQTMLAVSPSLVHRSIVQALVSVTEIPEENNVFAHQCLELLCELAIQNPQLAAHCNGITTIFNATLNPSYECMFSSLVRVILFLLNDECTRKYIRPETSLQLILWPLTSNLGVNLQYQDPKDSANTQQARDKRTGKSVGIPSEELNIRKAQLLKSRQFVFSVLQSWQGIIEFSSDFGLESLVSALKLPKEDFHDAILDMFFDLFHTPKPIKPTNVNRGSTPPSSTSAVSSSIAKLAKPRHNLLVNYWAMLLIAVIKSGLIEVLVSISNTPPLNYGLSPSNPPYTTKATALLGDLLLLASKILSPEQCADLQQLPSLVNSATLVVPPHTGSMLDRVGDHQPIPPQAARAIAVITNLHSHSRVKVSISQSINILNQQKKKAAQGEKNDGSEREDARLEIIEGVKARMDWSMDDEHLLQMIDATNVLSNKDYSKWNADAIVEVLEGPLVNPAHTETILKTQFYKRLLSFFKPREKEFSQAKITSSNERYTRAGKQLLRNLVKTSASDLLSELVSQIADCLKSELDENNAVLAGTGGTTSGSAQPSSASTAGGGRSRANTLANVGSSIEHKITTKTCDPSSRIFSSDNQLKTMSRDYFNILGGLTETKDGNKLLKKHLIYDLYMRTISSGREDLSKSILQCLDFNRKISKDILLCMLYPTVPITIRYRATQHLQLLLHKGLDNFHIWGIRTLIDLAMKDKDPYKRVVRAALSILDDACSDSACLEQAILRVSDPIMLTLLDRKGEDLFLRFLGSKSGLNKIDKSYLQKEMQIWLEKRNVEYVYSLESFMWEKLDPTVWQRNLKAGADLASDVVTLPPHLYGELSKTEVGLDLIKRSGHFEQFLRIITDSSLSCIQRRAAVMAMGQVGSTKLGFTYFTEMGALPVIVDITENCTDLTLRGMCFVVLGLLSQVDSSHEQLIRHGWTPSPQSHTTAVCIPSDIHNCKLLKVPLVHFEGSWASHMPPPLNQDQQHQTADTSQNLEGQKLMYPYISSLGGLKFGDERDDIIEAAISLINPVALLHDPSIKTLIKLHEHNPLAFQSPTLIYALLDVLSTYHLHNKERSLIYTITLDSLSSSTPVAGHFFTDFIPLPALVSRNIPHSESTTPIEPPPGPPSPKPEPTGTSAAPPVLTTIKPPVLPYITPPALTLPTTIPLSIPIPIPLPTAATTESPPHHLGDSIPPPPLLP